MILLYPSFTLYTTFLCSGADGVILYSDQQKYEEQLSFLILRGFRGHKQSVICKTLIILERKNSDFNMFIASVVQYRFDNLMIKHHTMQMHGVNESY